MSLITICKNITDHPLNQKRKINAIARFAWWQMRSRLRKKPVLYNWCNGSKFFVINGETGLTGNIYSGLAEFNEMGYLIHVLQKDDIFVDVGANCGAYTILAASVVGACSYSIEPIPETYNRLLNNIKVNEIEERVYPFNIGVGKEIGTLKFSANMDTVNHVIAAEEQNNESISVDVKTLDSILKNINPTMVKIDVEGYETPVLLGAEKILQNESLNSVIIELNGSGNRYSFDENEIVQLMASYGFSPYTYMPLQRELIKLNGINRDSDNTLFIRDEAAVLSLIKQAKYRKILGVQI